MTSIQTSFTHIHVSVAHEQNIQLHSNDPICHLCPPRSFISAEICAHSKLSLTGSKHVSARHQH